MVPLIITLGVLSLVTFYLIFAYRRMKSMPVDADNPKIKVLTEKTFDRAVSEGISVVDFWAAWCMPCRMMVPVLNDLADESGSQFTVCKVNIDENPAVARKFSVRSIPTLIIFRNGKEVDRIVGAKTKDALLKKINMLKYK